jgi:2-methylcitrate dehydratase PrpD
MTAVERLAEFVVRTSYDDLSEAARDQLKIRVLDSLGCAIGAMGDEPVQFVHDQVAEFGPSGACTLIGGGRTAPDRAAFYNGALVRYLDYNDGYLARGESCHPSDNLSAVLAACEYADRSGRDLMVARTVIKRHNAEIHAQTAIDAALELKRQHRFVAGDVDRIDVEVFDVAYKIIGGGEEGDKSIVCTKEDADHSLPYLVAVAILDNEVLPAQFAPDRIQRADVQQLLCRVWVRPSPAFSQRFPDEMAARITVTRHDGRTLDREVTEYPGLNAAALSWKHVARKFDQLSRDRLTPDQGRSVADAVQALDAIRVSDLTHLLATVGHAGTGPGAAASGSQEESGDAGRT